MPGFKIPTPLTNSVAVEKGSLASGSSEYAKKREKRMLPPLSDLVAMEPSPKKPNAQRLPPVADLKICIYKVGRSLFQIVVLRVQLAVGCEDTYGDHMG